MPCRKPKKASIPKHGILNALLPGAQFDKHTNKILVRTGTTKETITFNIGGTVFETFKTSLRGIPNSYLASEAFLKKHYRPARKDYFFDRDPEIFSCVLKYLRCGELHLPSNVCGPVVASELDFWGIDEAEIEECCWNRYNQWASTQRDLTKLDEDRETNQSLYDFPEMANASCWQTFCRKGWRFFHIPESSHAARIFAFFSLFTVFLSIFSFCAETHSTFRVVDIVQELNETAVHEHNTQSNNGTTGPPLTTSASGEYDARFYYDVKRDMPHRSLYYIDVACLIFFTLELLSRWIVAPHKLKFIIQPMTIIEILAVIPDYIYICAWEFRSSYKEFDDLWSSTRFLRVLRVFRVLRLMRHIPGLWILVYTMRATIKDLMLIVLFFCVGMLIFASLVYLAETDTQEEFSSIPKCFWWAVVTMTTVGYGDMSPTTNWGYLVGACCGMSGVLMIGLTVPVLVNHFIMYYQHTQRGRNRQDRRKSIAAMLNVDLNALSSRRASMLPTGGVGLRKLSCDLQRKQSIFYDANANKKDNGHVIFEEDEPKEGETVSETTDNEEDVKETTLL